MNDVDFASDVLIPLLLCHHCGMTDVFSVALKLGYNLYRFSSNAFSDTTVM